MISIFITFNHLSIDCKNIALACWLAYWMRMGHVFYHRTFYSYTTTAMSHPYKMQLNTLHVKQVEYKYKFESKSKSKSNQCIYNQFFIAIFNYQMNLRTVLLRCTVVLLLFQCSCFKCCLFSLFSSIFLFGVNSSVIVFVKVCETQQIVWLAELFSNKHHSVKKKHIYLVGMFYSKHSGGLFLFLELCTHNKDCLFFV